MAGFEYMQHEEEVATLNERTKERTNKQMNDE